MLYKDRQINNNDLRKELAKSHKAKYFVMHSVAAVGQCDITHTRPYIAKGGKGRALKIATANRCRRASRRSTLRE